MAKTIGFLVDFNLTMLYKSKFRYLIMLLLNDQNKGQIKEVILKHCKTLKAIYLKNKTKIKRLQKIRIL